MSGSAGNRLVWPNPFSVDAAGVPRVGAKLFFYQTGTNTPQATYSDANLSVPNTNPIIADEAGQFGSVFLLSTPAYKVVLQDANGNDVWTMDPVGFATFISSGVPVGFQGAYGGTAAPTGWLLCYGQAVDRTTYSLLFGAISTNYGVGNGTTTFNLPDKRGRVSVGKDNMGGTPANRVTAGGSGITGTSLAAVGGDQLLQAHTHTITDPGHLHGVTDPGHHHTTSDANFITFKGSGGNSNVVNGTTFGGVGNTTDSTTGVTINTASTGITATDSSGAGGSQNMPPSQIDNWIIFAGA